MNWKRIAIGGGIVAGLIGAGVVFTATQTGIDIDQVVSDSERGRVLWDSELKADINAYKNTHRWFDEDDEDYWRTHPEGRRLFERAFQIREDSFESRDYLHAFLYENCSILRPGSNHLRQYQTPYDEELARQCADARTEHDASAEMGKEIFYLTQQRQ